MIEDVVYVFVNSKEDKVGAMVDNCHENLIMTLFVSSKEARYLLHCCRVRQLDTSCCNRFARSILVSGACLFTNLL